MSRNRSQNRDSAFSDYERAGESSIPDSNYPLPRAQERVQQAIEREALSPWGMGHGPIPARTWVGARRYGQKPSTPLAERISRSQSFAELKQLRVRAPARTLFCAQRRERREVLFAKNRAGYRGSAKKRSWHRNQNSQYGC